MLKLIKDIFIAIFILILGAVIWFLLFSFALGITTTKISITINEPPTGLAMIQDNSLLPMCSINTIQMETLGSLVYIEKNSLLPISSLPENKPVIISDLMERIIFCESGWNYLALNPESGAWGLCQFLPSTMDYIQKKWGEKIDFSEPEQQLYACQRLLDEEGEIHWSASYNCWK